MVIIVRGLARVEATKPTLALKLMTYCYLTLKDSLDAHLMATVVAAAAAAAGAARGGQWFPLHAYVYEWLTLCHQLTPVLPRHGATSRVR